MFQSLFYWNAVLKWYVDNKGWNKVFLFQSLFYWNAVLKYRLFFNSCINKSVSILVLLECGLKAQVLDSIYCNSQVSILVLLECGLKVGALSEKGLVLYFVSILVLLECGLKAACKKYYGKR